MFLHIYMQHIENIKSVSSQLCGRRWRFGGSGWRCLCVRALRDVFSHLPTKEVGWKVMASRAARSASTRDARGDNYLVRVTHGERGWRQTAHTNRPRPLSAPDLPACPPQTAYPETDHTHSTEGFKCNLNKKIQYTVVEWKWRSVSYKTKKYIHLSI